MVDATMPVDVSVLIPVCGRFDDVPRLLDAYRDAVKVHAQSYEIMFVVDGPHIAFEESLAKVEQDKQPDVVLRMPSSFGEAACLMQGARRASGKQILILPAYFQLEPGHIGKLFEDESGADIVTAARDRSQDTPMNRLRGWFFDRCASLAGSPYRDPGCAVRLLRSNILPELNLQDEQHRFLPLIAERAGYSVKLMMLPQSEMDRKFRYHGPTDYLGALLDLISMGFLMRFMQKPFRFFGSIGAAFIAAGVLLGIYLVVERSFYGVAMGDRPMLLLVVLSIVLGLQIAVVGLIAEIVMFTRARKFSTYQVRSVSRVETADESTSGEKPEDSDHDDSQSSEVKPIENVLPIKQAK
ncbi:glycosyltransferase [Altererythrobacter sp. GH1-8]|uniref:glycosyltransferase n=1 Tax=Altererythrobacter sp. GH1-8 TaxID=3349333 RepID=UPI00374CE098